jgi:hypothetical protein
MTQNPAWPHGNEFIHNFANDTGKQLGQSARYCDNELTTWKTAFFGPVKMVAPIILITITVAVFSGAEVDTSVGKVFRISGTTVEVAGPKISRARRGQKLVIATSTGEIAIRVSEVFHTKLVCVADPSQTARIAIGNKVTLPGSKVAQDLPAEASSLEHHSDVTIASSKGRLVWKKCSEGSLVAINGCSLPSKYSQTCPGESLNCNVNTSLAHKGPISLAAQACAKLNEVPGFAQRVNWRLPTINELKNLIFCSEPISDDAKDSTQSGCPSASRKPAIHPGYFPNTPADCYWSSTIDRKERNLIYSVHFDNGAVSAIDRATYCFVRCVSNEG